MKKFLFILFLLAALGATGFFMGWTQLTVPPGSFGVMTSKTHGLESDVIQDGEFRWLWYKALPTNASVSVFNISPVRRSIRSSGSLVSGQTYANLSGINADFTWEISGELRYSIKPEILPELVRREYIRDDADLRTYENDLSSRIENLVLNRVKTQADSGDERVMETLLVTGTLPGLENEVLRTFPEIENLHIILRVVRLPDFDLYQSVRALYREYLSAQSIFLEEELMREAQNRIALRLRLDELAHYGELLTRFPVLLDYLHLEAGN